MLRIVEGDNAYMVTVSSKTFKRAVDRNRIKRLMREVIKAFDLIYLGKEVPTLETLKTEFNELKKRI